MTSASWIWSRTFWIAFTGGWRLAQRGRLLVGEGQDHRVEADHPVLLPAQVEVVSLHVLGALFEGDHGLQRRHLAERVGALVDPVAAAPRRGEPRSSEPIPKRPRYTTTQPRAQWSSSLMPGPSAAAPGPATRRQPGPPGLTLAQKRWRCSSGSGGVA